MRQTLVTAALIAVAVAYISSLPSEPGVRKYAVGGYFTQELSQPPRKKEKFPTPVAERDEGRGAANTDPIINKAVHGPAATEPIVDPVRKTR